MKLKRFFGDKAFYRSILAVALPIMLQNGITNFVSLLDNIMVGRLCTESMSGVSIVNQFLFIFYLVIFGTIAGAGIFSAQFQGSGDTEGVRNTFRLKTVLCLICGVAGICVFFFFGDGMIRLFLNEGSAEGDLALTFSEGRAYLLVMLISLIPHALTQSFASTMRETGETVQPMFASFCAVATNFCLNLVLIFGLLGFPALGVVGAAIATVVSKFVEFLYLLIYTLTHPAKFPWSVGAFRSLRVPGELIGKVMKKVIPLMANEVLFSTSVTLVNQCYSERGLDAVAAQNIASVIFNVFNVVYLALGITVSIMVGNRLGAGRIEEAKELDRKLIVFAVMCGIGCGILVAACAPAFPLLYNTTAEVRGLSSYMMIVLGVTMPILAFSNCAYFTLRTGGLIILTVLFDSAFKFVVNFGLCFVLSRFTSMNIHLLFAIGQGIEVLKVPIGLILLTKAPWARQLVPAENKGKEITA